MVMYQNPQSMGKERIPTFYLILKERSSVKITITVTYRALALCQAVFWALRI